MYMYARPLLTCYYLSHKRAVSNLLVMLLIFQSAASPVDRLQQVEQFCSNSLLPFLKSWGFTSILANLR